MNSKPEQKHPRPERPRVRRRRRQPFPACRTLGPEQLKETWAAYLANRGDLELRNRLVEHYAPWAREIAVSIAWNMGLRDMENAASEVLLTLVESIVPNYDGRQSFDRWARVCIRRKLIDQQRGEQNAAAVFVQPSPGSTWRFPAEPCARADAGRLRPRFRRVHRRADRSTGPGAVADALSGDEGQGNCQAFGHHAADGLHLGAGGGAFFEKFSPVTSLTGAPIVFIRGD